MKKWGETAMEKSIIIDREILPETIISYVHSEKIRLVEENGAITLSPVFDKYAIIEKSFGMFSDGKLSSERFIKEKAMEKELER
ncbi:MAG: hypothetical protein LBC77_04705 [Spirochaetaceae bacterium]|jgi:hypothetical protein|nr:hypothetical protein [Spirochaetaceae bacterium]